ncbi:chaplin [Streptomyces sp. NPDC087903]|uniref:chaplin n=1 Tax=Streptomyces sp. NPDC087903 TaxID=3365819 RepID=UPI0038087021
MSRIAKAAGVALGTGAVVLSGAGLAMADAGAQGEAVGSPGVLSGNVVQVPINIPINVCGNTVNVIGALNPAFGNHCSNDGKHGKHSDDGKHGKGHGKGHGKAGYGG